MSAITVSHLTRRFTTHVKQPGFTGALRGLIRRKYITKTAIDDVSFTIEPGEFVGFLGPNGAGKTTTLKILAGVLHPTSGTAEVLGQCRGSANRPCKSAFLSYWDRKTSYGGIYQLMTLSS
jgi:ABC-2 type transport system ATP-binding protein